jgi:taurine dioxygenase
MWIMSIITQKKSKIEKSGSKVSPIMGMEVKGLQLSEFDDLDIQHLQKSLIKNKLLIFRDQEMSSDELMALANQLGEVQKYPFSNGIDGYEKIVEIRKEPNQKDIFSGVWHIDSTYLPNPPDFTIFMAKCTPKMGGDTVFSDVQYAFSCLSKGMQQLLLTVKAEFASDKFQTAEQKKSHLANFDKTITKSTSFKSIHPLIKIHEVTGIPSIYANREHTTRMENMTSEESAPLLDYLFSHIAKSEFTFRVKWEKGTVVLWDNRGLQHHAVNDY